MICLRSHHPFHNELNNEIRLSCILSIFWDVTSFSKRTFQVSYTVIYYWLLNFVWFCVTTQHLAGKNHSYILITKFLHLSWGNIRPTNDALHTIRPKELHSQESRENLYQGVTRKLNKLLSKLQILKLQLSAENLSWHAQGHGFHHLYLKQTQQTCKNNLTFYHSVLFSILILLHIF